MKLIEKIENYWVIGAFLLSASFIAAAFTYKDLYDYLFPVEDETSFIGGICANRGKPECQKMNEDFSWFVSRNSGSGVPVDISVKYIEYDDWGDPCGGHGPIVGNGNYVAEGWIAYTFSHIKEENLRFNSFGDCVSRPNLLLFDRPNFPVEYQGQQGNGTVTILFGTYLITEESMGTLDRQITFTAIGR